MTRQSTNAPLIREFNPMFYYSYPQLAIFAFGVPALLGMFSVQSVFHLLSRRRGVGIGLAEKHTLWAVTVSLIPLRGLDLS